MSICKRIKNGWEGFWGAVKPPFVINQNNFDIKKILKRNEELVTLINTRDYEIKELLDRLNSTITINKRLTDENKHLKSTQDVFGLILEKMLPHTTLDNHKVDHYKGMIDDAMKRT